MAVPKLPVEYIYIAKCLFSYEDKTPFVPQTGLLALSVRDDMPLTCIIMQAADT